MRKSDLKNGMIVELRDGTRFICVDYKLIGMNTYDYMSAYNEDLTFKWEDNEDLKDLDIVKVYDSQMFTINDIFNTNLPNMHLLWEGEDKTDWTKVEFGTKVRVWDKEDSEKLEGVFLEYKPQYKTFPFRAYVKDEEYQEYISWQNCELA